ncbi:MAG: hypothetical protein AAGA46_00415 [Cyanobacteria bacterium P01_F01_bin.13]
MARKEAMKGYLGETKISIHATTAQDFGYTDWQHCWIQQYGGIDGEHHKDWLIDQCLRISLGTPVEVYLARWENGAEETRFRLGEPSAEYLKWVDDIEWSTGIAP